MAPEHVVFGLSALVEQIPVASFVGYVTNEAGTTWQAAWLTDNAIAYVEAERDEIDWYAQDDSESAPRKSGGWLRPISAISQISFFDQSAVRTEGNSVRIVDHTYEVRFSDGGSISLFAVSDDEASQEAAESFIAAVRSAWLTQLSTGK